MHGLCKTLVNLIWKYTRQKSLRKVLEGQDQAGPIMENPQHFLRVIYVLYYTLEPELYSNIANTFLASTSKICSRVEVGPISIVHGFFSFESLGPILKFVCR